MSDKKYFQNDLPKICAHCLYGTSYNGDENIYCSKKGVVEKFYHCIKYKYDPLKRNPQNTKPTQKFKAEDFSLD